MTDRIANRDARIYVAKRRPFKGSNLFAASRIIDDHDVYVVCSYGYHFPLYIAITDMVTHQVQWFKNCDRYSRTTAKHFGQCNPYTLCTPMETEKMIAIANRGVAGMLGVSA